MKESNHSEVIRLLKDSYKLTQEQLAKRLSEIARADTPINQTTVSRWLNGSLTVSADCAAHIHRLTDGEFPIDMFYPSMDGLVVRREKKLARRSSKRKSA